MQRQVINISIKLQVLVAFDATEVVFVFDGFAADVFLVD